MISKFQPIIKTQMRIVTKSFFITILVLKATNSFAQIGIGTKTPAPSAALEVTSSTNNKGILIPRITATQKDAIASPAQGLLVYQTTAPIGFYYYTGNSWKLMAIQTDLAGKVDKVDGKDLSSNDYTSAEKTKLAAITGTNTGDQTTITGNAGTATKLANARNINGVAFDGSADITLPAAAGTLTGIVAIANGGTNSTAAATAGGIGYGTGTEHAYTAAGTTGQVLSSNGAGVPTWITPSAGGIPYTGATAAVDLGVYDLKVNSLTVGKGGGSVTNNTAIGASALFTNTTGNNNTALGYAADVASGALTNATAIGASAIVSASNTIQLGNTDVTNVKTSGTITAGAVTYPKVDGAANQVLSTNGSGTLAWTTPTGLPSSGNTAGDMLYWNGTAWVKVPAGSNGQSLFFQNGTPKWNGTFSYRNTVKTATGRVWMDRNLGASQVATSATDALAYGDLYQWGRGSDGHESRSAGETNIVSTSDTPGNGNFINHASNRWRDPTNLNLWQGVNGINNPCPSGFRLPTKTEWQAEIATWTGSGFDSPLKLPLGGHQHPILTTPWQVGGSGSYWTSTPNDGLHSWNLGLGATSKTMGIAQQGHGFSVRCIMD